MNTKNESHLTHSQFLRMVRDSGVKTPENTISIMMSSTLKTKQNLMNRINFHQFLNLVSGLAELVFPQIFRQNPKDALQKLIMDHLLVLLYHIEGPEGTRKHGMQAAFSQSIRAQRSITYDEDIMVLMNEIKPLLRMIYLQYFTLEIQTAKTDQKYTDLR